MIAMYVSKGQNQFYIPTFCINIYWPQCERTNEKYPQKTAELYGTAVCCTAYFPNYMPTQYILHDPL